MNSSIFGICAKVAGDALSIFDNYKQKNVAFVEKESSRDVVSEADLSIQKYIIEELEKLNYPIISEEKENDFSNIKKSEFCWVIDPIDGTANFSRDISFYGVSLGAFRKGEIYCGAFGMPATKEFFYMVDKKSAYLNEKKLKVVPDELKNVLIAVSFSSRKTSSEEERTKEFNLFGKLNDKSRGALRLGSAATNICYAAAGKLGIAYGHKNKIWDIAAALAIAKAAGCSIYMSEIEDNGAVSFVLGHEKVVLQVLDEIANELNIEMKEI